MPDTSERMFARLRPRWPWLCAGLLIVLHCLAAHALTRDPQHARLSRVGVLARQDVMLAREWKTVADDNSGTKCDGFENAGYDDSRWESVRVPHNWQGYYNNRQVSSGSRHGFAWYRTWFRLVPRAGRERIFLMFEGVGSYAQVWVNGKPVGEHAGSLTTFTLDITDAVHRGTNLLAVLARNPRGIRDLPWVSGDDKDEQGFAEGSQPFGIFRPVHLIRTAEVRIEPFGVHVWNASDVSQKAAQPHVRTEVRNYGQRPKLITVLNRLYDTTGTIVSQSRTQLRIDAGASLTAQQDLPVIANPHLWSPGAPYLYRLHTTVIEQGRVIDETDTPYGIRWISWENTDGSGRFLLNGKPVFLNGTAEYEHLLGASHAFSPEQIRARVRQVQAAGFNAFRDAHYPHNLRYQHYWDQDGLLWWPQFSAHVWFDNPEFRANFKRLLADWVKERRNSPSVILWGLQNESVLPEDFAAECLEIIRRLDPTASSQRKIVTCNFGKGTDWNVPQNWSGTYGGIVEKYDAELEKARLVGEYGAWRSIDFHTEDASWKDKDKRLSEDRMSGVLEAKVRLAESVRDKAAGHFQWIFSTHENPGRSMREDGTQIADGIRSLDSIGPANNKGLLTIWGEPLDAYYMYRAYYAPKTTQPMVYIVSHTWPDRWTSPGLKSGIVVYSNCDEVELFNDVGYESLGKREPDGGGHFQWDDVPLKYNVLYATGKVGGRVVAKDMILLHYLPAAPHLSSLTKNTPNLTRPADGERYLYRVHCGGPEYRDVNGNLWAADRHFRPGDRWGFTSWAEGFANLDPELGSKRQSYDFIAGTRDPGLFRSFRYGREKLQYTFTVPDGEYRLELYFAEPWYGRGNIDAKGWRLFDVAVNGQTVLHDLDIWVEAGFAHALKKTVTAKAVGGRLVVSFPRVASYQAMISAIAVSTPAPKAKLPDANAPSKMHLCAGADTRATAGLPPQHAKTGRAGDPGLETRATCDPQDANELIGDLQILDRANAGQYSVQSYLDNGDLQYGDDSAALARVPALLAGSAWIRTASQSKKTQWPVLLRFTPAIEAEVYVAHDKDITQRPGWLNGWEDTELECASTGTSPKTFLLYRKRFAAREVVELGGNGAGNEGDAAMYSVFVKRYLPSPFTPVQPKRKKTAYPARQALSNGKIEMTRTGDEYLRLPETGEASVRWKINVGISGRYALTFRYSLPGTAACDGNVGILDHQANIVVAMPVRFSPSEENQAWRDTTVKTGASINAGDFDVLLSLPSACGMAVDSLGVE